MLQGTSTNNSPYSPTPQISDGRKFRTRRLSAQFGIAEGTQLKVPENVVRVGERGRERGDGRHCEPGQVVVDDRADE